MKITRGLVGIGIIVMACYLSLYADFERTYHTLPPGSLEIGYALIECPDGGFLLGATCEGFGRSTLLIRTNSRGDTLWMRQFGGYGNEMTCASLFASPEGGYISGGMGTDSVFNKALLMRFYESGDTLWTRRYFTGRNCGARATIPTLDNGCLMVGVDGGDDWYLVRTKEIGDTLWTKTLNFGFEPAGNTANAVIELPDSNFLVSGRAVRSDINWKTLVVRLTSTGDTIWTRGFGFDCGAGYFTSNCYKINPVSDGNYLLIGDEFCLDCCSDGYIAKFDADGNLLWQNHYDHAGQSDGFYAGLETDDSGFLLAGYCDRYNPGGAWRERYTAWLVRINSEGDTLWTRTYGPTHTGTFNNIIRTRDGGFAVVGTISTGFGTDSFDVYLVKLDPAGFVEWERAFPSENLTAYPNPSSGSITLELPTIISGNNGFKVTDAFGRTVAGLPRIATPFEWQFPPQLPNGVYFLQVGTDGISQSRRIILTR